MAYATDLTIGTGSKASFNFQSSEVTVTVSYELERGDTDLLKLAEEKAAEVERAHQAIWQRIRSLRAEPTNDLAASSTASQTDCVVTFNGSAPPSSNGAEPKVEPDEPVAPQEQPDPPQNGHGAGPLELPVATAPQRRAINALVARAAMDAEALTRLLTIRFSKSTVEELTKREASLLLVELQRTARQPEPATIG